jgi:drug/metabolite transporter (DMT)-like permease
MYLLLLLVSLIWAGSFIAIKIALSQMDPYNLAFYRFLIATPILIVIFKPRLILNLREIAKFTILGLSGVTFMYVIQFSALELTTATKASILINTSAIFTALLSYLFLKEIINIKKLLGVLIAFLGVFLVVSNGEVNFKPNLGDLLMIFDGVRRT